MRFLMTRALDRRLSVAILLTLLLATPAFAQSTNFGSIYSRYGVGMREMPFSPIAQGMGGGGFALGGSAYSSLSNPAAISDLSITRAVAGFQIQSLEASDATGATGKETSGALSGFLFGVPLMSGRLGLALGVMPFSRSGYRVKLDRTFDPMGQVTTSDAYSTSFEGNGGLDRISLAAGYRLARGLSVGLRGDLTFGILEDVQLVAFEDTRFKDIRLSGATRLHGFGAGIGIRGVIPSVIRDGDALSLGVFMDTPTHLTGARVTTVGSSFEPDTLGTSTDGSMDLPMTIGGGIAYQSGARLVVVADALYEPWSRFESTFSLPGYDPAGSSGMTDRKRFSAGFEFYPAGRDLLAGLLKRTAYRFGVFVEQAYVSPDPTHDLRSFGLTAGVSLPTLFPGTRVDINVEAGNRGSTRDMLIKDRYLRFGVNVNFADRWFVRRPLN